MPQVTLTLNGRAQRFICDASEVEHFRAIAAYLEGKVDGIFAEHGKVPHDQALVMAAVQIVDELLEARGLLAQAEEAGKAAEARAAARRAARVGSNAGSSGAAAGAVRSGDGATTGDADPADL